MRWAALLLILACNQSKLKLRGAGSLEGVADDSAGGTTNSADPRLPTLTLTLMTPAGPLPGGTTTVVAYSVTPGTAPVASVTLGFAADGLNFVDVAPLPIDATTYTWTVPVLNVSAAALRLVGTAEGVDGAAIVASDPFAIASPVLSLSDASHDFGSLPVAGSSSAFSYTVNNTGGEKSGALTITPSGDTSDFIVTNNCTDVAGGDQCQVSVTFAPQSSGAKTLSFAITDSQGHVLFTGTATGIALSAPVLGSTTEAFGPTGGGQTLSVFGAGFIDGPSLSVLINGVACAATTFVSDTQVTCNATPPGSGGPYTISVQNGDGQVGSLAGAYSYVAAPAVTSLGVSFGPTGGGATLTVDGTGFIAAPGLTVSINGVACTSTTFVSATQVTCNGTPAGSGGPYVVTVQNGDGQTGTLAGAYTYVPAPTVTSLSLSFGPQAGGAVVAFNGTGFINASGLTASIKGVPCASTAFNSTTQVTCNGTPAGTGGPYAVSVHNADGQSGSLTSAYTYVSGPTIASLSVSFGPTGGNANVVVNGTGFVSSVGLTVSINGVACASTTFNSSTQVTCSGTPAGSGGPYDVSVQNGDGQTATLPNAYSYVAAPTVTSVGVPFGPTGGGAALTINGSGFQSGAGLTATINGVACASTSYLSATQVTCNGTPSGGGGPYTVSVQNADGQSGSLSNAYTYVAAPTVTSLSMAFGPTGGGAVLTINGTGFKSNVPLTAKVNGVACATTSFVSATQVTCNGTPAGSGGPYAVSVQNADGQSGSLAGAYTYVAAPTVTAANPPFGPTGGAAAVTITGTGFKSSAPLTAKINSVACGSTTFNSATQVTCNSTPAGSGGPYAVSVSNADGQSGSLASAYTYVGAPTVTAISVPFGPTGGGAALTITGTGFKNNAPLTAKINGVACTATTFNSTTQVTCTTPAGSGGPFTVSVTNADGQSGSLAGAYTYVAAPAVTAVSLPFGPTGGGVALTITGTGFQNAVGLTAKINNVACSATVFNSATQVTCTTPAGSGGPFAVSVTNADGQSGALAGAYTFVAAPTVTVVTPPFGPTGGGAAVTITGTGFKSNAPLTAKINSVACATTSFVSATQVTCNSTPAGTGGPFAVSVTNADGQAGSLANAYTYVAAPTVTAISLPFGPTGGGVALTITGTGFKSNAGLVAKINGVSCGSTTFNSATQVTCNSTPAGSGGAYAVSVSNADGQSGSLAGAYTYVGPPTVTALSVAFGPTGGGVALTITGTGFKSNAPLTAKINNVACGSTTFNSATQVTCNSTPAGSGGPFAVSVTNADNQSGSLASAYTYVAAPTVTGIAPTTGPTTGGTSTTITGTGFRSGAVASVGGTNCSSTVYSSATQVSCTTPVGSLGAQTVRVQNADGQAGSKASLFTYVQPPPSAAKSTFTVAPTGLIAGNSTTLTATVHDSGDNPISGMTVTFAADATQGTTFTPAASCTTNGSGICNVSFSSSVAELKNLTATASTMTLNASVTFTGAWYPASGSLFGVFNASAAASSTAMYYAGGSVFRTLDGNGTFSQIRRGLPLGAFTAVAASTSDPTLAFLVHSTGVYRTTNANAAAAQVYWSRVLSGTFYDVAISGTTVYAAANGSGVYKSTDSGATFSPIAGWPGGSAQNVRIHPTDANRIFVGTSGSGAYQYNAGWTAMTGAPSTVVRMEVDSRGPDVWAIGNSPATVYKSTGLGAFGPLAPTFASNLTSLALDTTKTPAYVYLGTVNDGVYQMTSTSAYSQYISGFPAKNSLPQYTNVNALHTFGANVYADTTATVLGNTTGTWNRLSSTSITSVPDFIITGSGTNVYASTDDTGDVYKSADGGTSWGLMSTGLPRNGIHPGIWQDPYVPDKIWANVWENGIWSWTSPGPWTSLSVFGGFWFAATWLGASPGTMWIGGSSGVEKWNGSNFINMNYSMPVLGANALARVSVAGVSTVAVAQGSGGPSGGLWYLSGPSGPWLQASGYPATQTAYLWVSTTGASDATVVYAGGYGQGIWKSTDGGVSYLQTSRTTDTVYSMAIKPGDTEVWAAVNYNTVIHSTDGGSTWSTVTAGLGDVQVIRLFFAGYAGNESLYAGTATSGVWRTDTGGIP